MTREDVALLRRVGSSVLLLASLLSMAACQLNAPEPETLTTSALATDVADGLDTGFASEKTLVEAEAVLSVRQAPLLAGVSEKRFVIPVARSGDLTPDKLDDYVLSIIEASRQWDYVSEIQIHGHTDSEGSELSNMLLSIRRANRVAERFEALGVEAGLLLIEAHGETQALADNTTLDGRIANRRIEVVLLGNPGQQLEERDPNETVLAKLRPQGEKP